MPLELPSATAPRAAPGVKRLAAVSRRRVNDRDRMFFTEQLALLLETGANLYNALRTLRAQSQKPAMENLLDALLTDVAEGRPFAQALAKHPDVFSPSYVNLVAASEQGGFMHKVLYELEAMEQKRAELKSTLVGALSYPAFLLVFSFAVVVFVLLVVFPKFGELFTKIYDQLPAVTKVLMALSESMLDYGVYMIVAIGLVAAALAHWIATPSGRASVDRLLLRAPLARDILVELYMVQVLRVISLSLGNGVSMIDTLRACRDVVGNTVFKRHIDDVATLVEEGRGMARGFEQIALVPSVAKTMIRTAEESGNLVPVAARVADYYEQQLTRRLKTVSRLAEPIMLLVMGGVVGLLVSSLILPIFKLARAVS